MNKIQKITLPLLALLTIIGCTRNFYGVKPSEPGSEEQMVMTVFTRGVNLSGCFDVSEGNNADNIWMGHINDDTFQHLTELGIDVVRVPMTFGRFVFGFRPLASSSALRLSQASAAFSESRIWVRSVE